MFDFTRAAGSDHRDATGVRNSTRQLDIVTVACAVAIHTRQEYLTGAELFRTPRPLNRIEINRASTAVRVNFPAAGFTPARVDRYDNTLTSKNLRTGFDQLR